MSNKDIKILIFSLNNENYAVNISDVERILGYTQATSMPEAPFFVEGVINYENSILPIINIGKKFNINSVLDGENKKIIVIKREEKKFGIVVDNVYEVRDIDGQLVEEAPPITSGVSNNYLQGLIKLGEKIVILLNVGKILSEDEEAMIF